MIASLVADAVPGAPPAEPSIGSGDDAKPTGMRRIYLDEWIEVPVYRFGDLRAGQNLQGPAIIEADTTTVLLLSEDVATVTDMGWLDIAVGG